MLIASGSSNIAPAATDDWGGPKEEEEDDGLGWLLPDEVGGGCQMRLAEGRLLHCSLVDSLQFLDFILQGSQKRLN